MSEDPDDKTQVLNRKPVVSAPSGPPALLNCVDTSVLKDGVGAQIPLHDDDISVGRDGENSVPLHAQGVSKYHARIFVDAGRWTVEDLGSTNGTRVNNSKLEAKQALEHGDTVAFGRACYKFQIIASEEAGTATGIDIDLGASDKTMVMRPSQKPGAAAAPAAAAAAAAATQPRPKAAATTQVKAKAAATARSAAAAKSSGSSNIVLWLIVVIAVVALVGGGAALLGFI